MRSVRSMLVACGVVGLLVVGVGAPAFGDPVITVVGPPSVSQGDTFSVSAFVSSAAPFTLRAEQLEMPCTASGGLAGSVDYAPGTVALDSITYPEYVFVLCSRNPACSMAVALDQGNCAGGFAGRLAAATQNPSNAIEIAGGVSYCVGFVPPPTSSTFGLPCSDDGDCTAAFNEECLELSYLGTFGYVASAGALGNFCIDVAPDPLTLLKDEFDISIPFTSQPYCVSILPGCASGAVVFNDPPDGVVDARQDHPVSSTTPLQGIDTFDVDAPSDADDMTCWALCETDDGGSPNGIASIVDNGGGNYTITLDRPITPGAVTTLTYDGGTTGTFIAHPGNVNGDTFATPIDILAIIDCFNGVNQPINCPWGFPYSQDIDSNGGFGPTDILAVIDLLNGAGTLDMWNNTPLPENPGTCP